MFENDEGYQAYEKEYLKTHKNKSGVIKAYSYHLKTKDKPRAIALIEVPGGWVVRSLTICNDQVIEQTDGPVESKNFALMRAGNLQLNVVMHRDK